VVSAKYDAVFVYDENANWDMTHDYSPFLCRVTQKGTVTISMTEVPKARLCAPAKDKPTTAFTRNRPRQNIGQQREVLF